jgi:predicted dehydrogenase
VSVVGVADPDIEKAQKALAERLAGPARRIYAGAKAYPDERALIREAKPDAVFIGVPPTAHGQSLPPHDMEMLCAAHGIHIFIDQPLSVLPPEEMISVAEAMDKAAGTELMISVGYMFRYSRAVEKMCQILSAIPGGPKAVQARYACAYTDIQEPHWWDVRRSGGPIIEQATHFCDLARLLCGEVDLSSVSAVGIPQDGPAGELVELPTGPDGRSIEQHVPPEHRPPVATTALWRHRQGAIGSLLHGVMLHGWKDETELEIWADGLRMVLSDPYHSCRLSVRYPHSQETEVLSFGDDDPFLTEVAAFLQAIRTGSRSLIRSTYADAMRSHEFAWSIRRAYESTMSKPRETLSATA